MIPAAAPLPARPAATTASQAAEPIPEHIKTPISNPLTRFFLQELPVVQALAPPFMPPATASTALCAPPSPAIAPPPVAAPPHLVRLMHLVMSGLGAVRNVAPHARHVCTEPWDVDLSELCPCQLERVTPELGDADIRTGPDDYGGPEDERAEAERFDEALDEGRRDDVIAYLRELTPRDRVRSALYFACVSSG